MRAVAAHVSAPGTVVVVCGAEQSQTAVLGDLIATRLVNAGVVAVVTDGLVRDSRAIAELGLPVWCRGVTPRAGAKAGVGRIGGPASLGGVAVSDGDLVVADADGVVVWAADRVAEFLRRAEDKRRADAAGG
jgi:regulator of RNase E activity RraA